MCLLRLAHSSSCHQHHGEKEKLRGPGAGEWPWHPSAHPDLPMEANQVRAASPGYLGYSCNRAVKGGQGGGQTSCCPVVGRKWLLQLQHEGVKQAVLFALDTEQSVCVGDGGRTGGSLT